MTIQALTLEVSADVLAAVKLPPRIGCGVVSARRPLDR
jgi:hypothetical protein